MESLGHNLHVRKKTGLSSLYEEETVFDDTTTDWKEQAKTRLRLACSALQRYPAVRALLRQPVGSEDRKYAAALAAYPEMPKRCRKKQDREAMLETLPFWLECDTQHLATYIASDWPHDGRVRTTGGLTMGAILWFASIAFSAVNIAA